MLNTDRPYHHGDLREELLRIALRLGREQGPSAITIRQVTREAGVSPTSAYRHYRDQAALLSAVAAVAGRELQAAFDDTLVRNAAESARHKLMACCETYVDFATTNKNFFDCIVASQEFGLAHVFDIPESTIANPGAVGNSEVPTYTAFADLIYDIVKEQGTTVEISHVDAAIVAVWSAVHGLAALLNNGYLDVYGDEKKQTITSAVIANAIRGISLDEVTEPRHSD